MNNSLMFPAAVKRMEGDPYWNHVLCLLQFDGGSIDQKNNTWNYVNGADNSGPPKYGSGSYNGNGLTNTALISSGLSTTYVDIKAFTIDAWVYRYAVGPIFVVNKHTYGNSFHVGITIDTNGQVYFSWNNTSAIMRSLLALSIGEWSHVAVVRDDVNNPPRMYINGINQTEFSLYQNVTWPISKVSGEWIVGNNAPNNLAEINYGYVDDVRVTSGIARYTTDFTPPPRKFLSKFVKYDPFYDNTTCLITLDNNTVNRKTLTSYTNNITFSNSDSKFAEYSGVFDSAGDRVEITSGIAPTSGAFTIEMWVKHSDWNVNSRTYLRHISGQNGFDIHSVFGTDELRLTLNGAAIVIGGGNVPGGAANIVGLWRHVAFTRIGDTWRGFWHGVKFFEVTNSNSVATPSTYWLGANAFSSAYDFRGEMNHFRFTNFCRYTVNFEPPTAKFPEA